MRILFGRVGNKTPIAEHIVKLLPDHKVYVEPFVGSGAVYFHKEPSSKEVINDLDKELISGYKLVKQVSSDVSKYNDLVHTKSNTRFITEHLRVKKIN